MSTETLVLLAAALLLWQRSSKEAPKPAGTEYGPDYPIGSWGDGGTLWQRADGSKYVRHPDGTVEAYADATTAPPASAGG